MYSFYCKYKFLIPNRVSLTPSISHKFHLGIAQYTRLSSLLLPTKSFSSSRKTRTLTQGDHSTKHAFTVSYLTKSCGLPQESAISASKFVKFESSTNPDLVLSLFRDYGFENAQISKVVSKVPNVLVADPINTLMPKLEFFRSTVGLPGSELATYICSRPYLLHHNLKNRVMVLYDFLKGTVVGDDAKVAAVLSQYWRIPGSYVQNRIVPNIEFVTGLGMPTSKISSLVCFYPYILSQRPESFCAKVKEVIDMGFNPSHLAFVTALAAVTKMSKSTWQLKIQVFKRLGWSDEDVNMAFRKNPVCFRLSEQNIENKMNFLVKEMDVTPRDIARLPIVLNLSLEKRVIPRCLLVRFIQLKGLLKNDLCMLSYLMMSEVHFLNKFVIKYQEQVPQLMGLYKGELKLLKQEVQTGDIKLESFM